MVFHHFEEFHNLLLRKIRGRGCLWSLVLFIKLSGSLLIDNDRESMNSEGRVYTYSVDKQYFSCEFTLYNRKLAKE